jgi:hypothetical protein
MLPSEEQKFAGNGIETGPAGVPVKWSFFAVAMFFRGRSRSFRGELVAF